MPGGDYLSGYKMLEECVSFLSYTNEELRELFDFLSSQRGHEDEHGVISDFKLGLKNCRYNAYHIMQYPFSYPVSFSIFTTKMIALPLHINDDDLLIAAIAKWRLFIGK